MSCTGNLHDLKDKVEGTVDQVVGKTEGGVKGGLRELKRTAKKDIADARSKDRAERK